MIYFLHEVLHGARVRLLVVIILFAALATYIWLSGRGSDETITRQLAVSCAPLAAVFWGLAALLALTWFA